MSTIPSFIRPFLWSYDISKIDFEKNKKRIITNVLNLGTVEATNWLFDNYSREDILDAVEHPIAGEWSKKSFNYWALMFGVNSLFPEKRRFVS